MSQMLPVSNPVCPNCRINTRMQCNPATLEWTCRKCSTTWDSAYLRGWNDSLWARASTTPPTDGAWARFIDELEDKQSAMEAWALKAGSPVREVGIAFAAIFEGVKNCAMRARSHKEDA